MPRHSGPMPSSASFYSTHSFHRLAGIEFIQSAFGLNDYLKDSLILPPDNNRRYTPSCPLTARQNENGSPQCSLDTVDHLPKPPEPAQAHPPTPRTPTRDPPPPHQPQSHPLLLAR